jgi:hypothetical protein
MFYIRTNRGQGQLTDVLVQEVQNTRLQDTHESLACLGRFTTVVDQMREEQSML